MKIKHYFSLVRFSHTIFAMPFALVGFFMATQCSNKYDVDFALLFYVILCMFFARNAAMSFNRLVDKYWDTLNKRTAEREIPKGLIKTTHALFFVIINSAAFIITTYFINSVCFYLSPIALILLLGYSYTKRFTFMSHFILGIGLGLAPVGAFLAVSGEFNLMPILLGIAVWAWVSGFDIIYSMNDIEFDRQNNLFSVPAKFGLKAAFCITRITHTLSALVILSLYFRYFNNSIVFGTGTILFVSLLLYQNLIIGPYNLKRINFAFFNLNGLASILFAIFAIFAIIYSCCLN